MKLDTWYIDLNGIEHNNIGKHPYPTCIKKCETLIMDTRMVLKKDNTWPTLVITSYVFSMVTRNFSTFPQGFQNGAWIHMMESFVKQIIFVQFKPKSGSKMCEVSSVSILHIWTKSSVFKNPHNKFASDIKMSHSKLLTMQDLFISSTKETLRESFVRQITFLQLKLNLG